MCVDGQNTNKQKTSIQLIPVKGVEMKEHKLVCSL